MEDSAHCAAKPKMARFKRRCDKRYSFGVLTKSSLSTDFFWTITNGPIRILSWHLRARELRAKDPLEICDYQNVCKVGKVLKSISCYGPCLTFRFRLIWSRSFARCSPAHVPCSGSGFNPNEWSDTDPELAFAGKRAASEGSFEGL